MNRNPYLSRERGFSLMEMAVVLMILGILLNGLLVAVGQSSENTRRLSARNELRQMEEALYGFAMVHGRLPCPADYDTNGLEDLEDDDPVDGVCNLSHGFFPNATLNFFGNINGIGLLLDPWGNPYRYSVATATAGGELYTGTDGIDDIFDDPDNEIVTNANMLVICDASSDGGSTCTGNTIANIVPAVVLSMGDNWATLGASSTGNERANAYGTTLGDTAPDIYQVSSNNIFVKAEYSEDNFDDMLVWLSPHVLFSKMISAGKLP